MTDDRSVKNAITLLCARLLHNVVCALIAFIYFEAKDARLAIGAGVLLLTSFIIEGASRVEGARAAQPPKPPTGDNPPP